MRACPVDKNMDLGVIEPVSKEFQGLKCPVAYNLNHYQEATSK